MAEQRVQRRLAAILAADVVGYSALMHRAKEATYGEFERLKRELIEPSLCRHDGRLIKTTGDGALAEFAGPSAAVRCAMEIQESIASGRSSLKLRIGINLGEVIVGADGDLFGDGINIAVRLEGVADPGGILISEKVHSEVEAKLDISFEDRGEHQLKNISKPVRAFAVGAGTHGALIERLNTAPPLPDKPSIAVLPFENLSGDPEQEYFADGTVEEITTALSRFKSLFVIARNSSFTYKGKAIDLKRVGDELGVRYVLEGSVRKAGCRLRIVAQLIDAASGAHIWADHFDGALENVFDLQDEVTKKVVGAIAPRVERAEIVRAWRRPPKNTDAYDCYLRGLACLSPMTADGLEQALSLFTKASALDPDYASAYGMAMHCHAHRIGLIGPAEDIGHRRNEISRLWQTVARVGQDDGVALGEAAWAVAYLLRDLPSARQLIDRALELNPNLASAWASSGWISIWQGNPDLALEHLSRAERLDPGSLSLASFAAIAHACFFLGDYEKALGLAERGLRHSPDAHVCLRIGSASAAFAGRVDTARRLAARLQEIDPAFGVSRLSQYIGPYQKSVLVEKYAEGMRLAGLPE